MRASSGFVRLFIRGLQWDAQESDATFADTLKAAARGALRVADDGKVLIEAQVNGSVSRYQLPQLGDLTARDITELCSELLDKLDSVTEQNPSYADEQIVTAILSFYPNRSRNLGSTNMIRQNFGVGIRRGGY